MHTGRNDRSYVDDTISKELTNKNGKYKKQHPFYDYMKTFLYQGISLIQY